MGTYNGVDDDAIFSNLRAFQIWFEVKNDTFDMHVYVEGNEDDAIKEVVKWTLANGYRWVRILSWHETKLNANKM